MLEVSDIYKNYEGKPLLSGVSFRIEAGETVCLLGSSGSGKSTLLRIISGLEHQDAGQVMWDGRDLKDVPVHKRQFGLMFQEYALFPHKSVAENVAFGLRMQGAARSEIQERVKQALDLVNMPAFLSRRVTDLSGGEQQRVALARAIAPRPRLLMLDEPLGALDRTLKEDLEGEIRHLLHMTGIPAIYVTHDQEEAFAVADRLILLNQGRIEQSGSPVDVFRKPVSAWVARFLGLNNLLPGKLVSLSPLQAATDLGILHGSGSLHQDTRPGDPVTVLVRPGGAKLASVSDQKNILLAKVQESVFRGSGFRVRVTTAGARELAFFMNQALPQGTEVRLALAPEDIQFL